MKKTLAIFLLQLMLVIGALPAVAMHFCGGELRAVGVFNDVAEQTCCSSASQPEHGVSLRSEGCCDIQIVELTTDDYHHTAGQSDLNKILPLFKTVWQGANSLARVVDEGAIKTSSYFPPGGFGLHGVDLLTFICIYRI